MPRMTHRKGRSLLGLAALTLVGLTGCAGSPTFLTPNSAIADEQSNLFMLLLALSAVVFLFVEGWLVVNLIRYRDRGGEDAIPKQVHGNTRLEITWTVIPLLLVGVLFILTVRTVNAVAAPSPSSSDLNVHVVGHRWWWEFGYPDYGFVTANELHVPVNATVQFSVDSVDVIHSFWVPQLSGKVDAIPGQTNHLWFRAKEVGRFHGQCSEYCGLNHANMRILVIVESRADFDAWVKNQQAPPPPPQGEMEQKAHDMIAQGICSNCHTLGDSGSEHPVGPDLTHLFSRSVFAGAIYDLNEDNIRRWLTQYAEMKPGNDMSVKLSPEDVDALMAYLTKLH